MTKEQFINDLSAKTGLDINQAGQINDILESTSLLGQSNKEKIISMTVEKLGVSEQQADEIYNASMEILKDNVVDKINPFKK
ncbi:MAG: hypothetical protein IJG09_03995 [Methanobrevibacter sp.]|nr:hypothetical protein [Methanobrevibacter sp.]